jgi:predicted amidohydrolase
MIEVLSEYRFDRWTDIWKLPADGSYTEIMYTGEGCAITAAPDRKTVIEGSGVHTYNGDSIELRFSIYNGEKGILTFGYEGGTEQAIARLDLKRMCISLYTSDWRCRQPVCSSAVTLENKEVHSLIINKNEGSGRLVKNADIEVFLDGMQLISNYNINVLPEMGVTIGISGVKILLRSFIHRGSPRSIPEYLVIGGWQVLNVNSIERNLDSICRGLIEAAEKGVQLLVTPETSLTGLYPDDPVTNDPVAINEAESKLRRFIRKLKNAPYLVVGFPFWKKGGGNRKETRYNVSRVYDPDGGIIATCPKIHSCENNFWHGYRLHEFNICGVPVTMHICHDWGYPELRTLPVMFGARLVIRPANDGTFNGSVEAFEAVAKYSALESQVFYMNINGGGGSYIVGPRAYYEGVIDSSLECRKDNPSFPAVGKPQECIISSKIRIHDAFGYWPVRSFRASENIAEAYLNLYRSLGGCYGN